MTQGLKVMIFWNAGTSKFKHFDENLGSLNVKLCPHEVAEVAAAVPETEVAGSKEGFKMTWKSAHTPLPSAPSPDAAAALSGL